jgi:Putative prokaryotic signal transducing protein
MKTDDLVVVRTFNTAIDAELAKSALDAADVDSFIQTDDAGGMRPHLAFAQGARLIVRAEDRDRATSILDADDSSA